MASEFDSTQTAPIEPELATFQGEEKALQILEGARQVFLSRGFDAASMNDIARAAGVSKGTIYFHFESKETLFEALIREERQQLAEQVCKLDQENPDVAGVLFEWGRSILTLILSANHIAQLRMVMAVAPKFPRLGQAFYEAGPKCGIEMLAAYFAKQSAAGKLNVPDPRQAAYHFMGLCQGEVFKEAMFCVIENVPAEDIDRTVAAAVDVFLRAYGP
jgi:AcrR family transcriptional regulator